MSAFPHISDGYYVGNDSGFGVIDGHGEVGNLVINREGVVGIVSQIGKDIDEGFMRIILWKDIKNIWKRSIKMKDKGLYLGISAKS
jgi:hypothetical protein